MNNKPIHCPHCSKVLIKVGEKEFEIVLRCSNCGKDVKINSKVDIGYKVKVELLEDNK